MNSVVDALNQVSNLNIECLVSGTPYQCSHCLQDFTLKDFFMLIGTVISGGLLYMAYLSYKNWNRQIKGEKLENSRGILVDSIINIVASLRVYTYLALSVSNKSEQNNPDIYKEIAYSDNFSKEIFNVDVEFTNMIRILEKDIKRFDFYNSSKDKDLTKKLYEYKTELHNFSAEVLNFVRIKFSAYRHSGNKYLQDKVASNYNEIQVKLSKIEEDQDKILERLKN